MTYHDLNISSKDELIDILLELFVSSETASIHEYSGNTDKDLNELDIFVNAVELIRKELK